jgi:hypothetical protein
MRGYIYPTPPVKAPRNTPRQPGRFGTGILDDGRTPEGVEELERLDREPRQPLPVDWDALGRQARIQELTEHGYRWA